ncbi:hypothetical protein KUTeg_025030 [Tegillarca granosa]|uniref:Uncharacterized protein n=1 Tax=Tegillarca granosa TaxID=220873 RepID=A0ABQ9E2X3_TEGGR|nr:hypothetical protein KUTeg_025030 [Tegillarca granosa]
MGESEQLKFHFVAALRFGSTKSGYAFSSHEEFLKGWPLQINADLWNAGPLLRCIKMPTSLLLNPDESFNSFGYDAENNFTDLVEQGDHREYFYFEKFTKNLYVRQRTEISVIKQPLNINNMHAGPVVFGPYGGKRIDDEFRRFLEEVWPGMTLEELKEESLEDYIELFKEFELKKCIMAITEPRNISITLPISLVELIQKSTEGMAVNEWLENSPYPEVQLRRSQHLQIPSQVLENLFQPTIDNILNLMKKVFNDEKYGDIRAIIMTGGFSKCPYLQRAVIAHFQSKSLIIPRNPDLVILEGSVVFGHSSSEEYLMGFDDQDTKEEIKISDDEIKDNYDEEKTVDEKVEEKEEIIKETIDDDEVKSGFLESEKKETTNEKITEEEETTDEEDESDQKEPVVSLFEYMKQKEEEEKQQHQKEGNVTPAVTQTFEQQVIQAQLSFNEVVEETIELDNKEINDMVLAAKQGNWNHVWSTLDKKPYLVNCIPEQRAWSALHQAIFHGGLEAVQRLVEDYEADITICTKPDKAHAAEPGTDALTLAKELGRKVIYDYLLKYTVERRMQLRVKTFLISERTQKDRCILPVIILCCS